MWAGASTAALVEQDNPVLLRIKKTTVSFTASRTRTTMYEQHWQAIFAAALLKVNLMPVINLQVPGSVRLDGGIQGSHE